MRSRPLVAFFVLTFAITWGLGACYALFPTLLEALFGKVSYANPLFFIAVYAPSWIAEDDTLILTIRWPSVANDQVEKKV